MCGVLYWLLLMVGVAGKGVWLRLCAGVWCCYWGGRGETRKRVQCGNVGVELLRQ